MTGDRYDQSGNFGIGHMSGGTITGNAKIAGVINETEIERKARASDAIDQGEIKRKILILAANPKGTTPLRLDEEVREITAGLKRANYRDQFVLESSWAVQSRDIHQAMLDRKPQIVHFSGHGMGSDGLVFEDQNGQAKSIGGEALAGLFELFAEQIECVVLNGCYSEVQANSIARHINYVIGMNRAISDEAAIEFAVGFYDALGAGESIEFAFKMGCAAIKTAGINEQLTPVLLKNSDLGKV